MKNVIDYFLFFNEKELLELRLNLLKDYVDEFIITELNYTHSGKEKEFICKKIVDELGFSDRVKVLEVNLDEDGTIENEIDIYNAKESNSSKEVKAWARERLQRDAILQEVSNYADDTVFIHGDCDEIINPEFINYFSSVCKNLEDNIIKIPLVLLEGRADKRLYEGDNFVPWASSLLMCTAKQLKSGGTPTKMRSNVMNEYPPVWITENTHMIQDCGWHFTWMGNESRRKEKANSFIHYANMDSVNTLSSESIKKITNKDNNTKLSKRNYPVELLPNIIFSLPKVKDFLLPIEEKQTENIFNFSNKPKSTVWVVDNFYESPEKVREFALNQDYVEGGIGRGFIGRRTEKQFLFAGLKEKFEEIMGKKIIRWEEHGMNGRFQIAWSGEPLVWHCDSQTYGGMLYLTPNAPFQCGTSLYAHKKTRARTYYEDGWDIDWVNPDGSHLDGTPWEPVDVLGNVYNRLVIFDGSCIHSASQYFGNKKENGRLWQMFFFDTE